MKIEKLETSNNKFKYIVVGFILYAVIFILINYLTSRASYRNTESIDLVKGIITYKVPDLNIIAMYKDGEPIETMPGVGYEIDTEESFCYTTNKDEHEAVELATDSEGNLIIGNLKKGSKCYLYFVKESTPSEKTLAKLKDISGSKYEIKEETTFDGTSSATEKILYKFQDNDGATYAFRGNPDNWVTFAGKTWRIIRINGDGTLRLLYYCGDETCTTSENAVEGVAYNTDYNDNTYVGYYYGTARSNDYNTTHSNKTPSTIATELITWYNNNLKQSWADKISENTGFCNDRQIGPSRGKFTGDGTGTKWTVYASASRLTSIGWGILTPFTPKLTCEQNDLYTTNGNKKGNGALDAPIGLITADEAAIGGLLFASSLVKNITSYVSAGLSNYWTMSPINVDSRSYANVFNVNSNGYLSNDIACNKASGVRPVINVDLDKVTIEGNGTKESRFAIM